MYLGSFQLGEEVTYRVHSRSSAGVPAAPDAAPLAHVYAQDGDSVRTGLKVPSRDYPRIVGLFEGRLQLNEDFEAGMHTIMVTWLVSGVAKGAAYHFTVLPGGDGSGQVTSLYSHPRPNANYIVQGRDSGRIYKGKNPRA